MEKLGLLPLAEKVSSDALFDNEPETKAKTSKSDIIWALAITAAFWLWSASVFVKELDGWSEILMLIIGVCILFSKSSTATINGRAVKSTLWVRIPFAFGLFLLFVLAYNQYFKDGKLEGFDIIKRVMSIAMILTAFGGVVYLFVVSWAISKRAEECTECVFAEPDSSESYDEIRSYTQKDSELTYRYCHDGYNYRFNIPEDVTIVFDDSSYFVVCIDPDKPERYYSEMLFRRNSKNMRTFLTVVASLLIFAFVLW